MHPPRTPVDALRGASRLVIEGTLGIAGLVEAVQLEIGGGPKVLGRPFLGVTRLFSAPVYAGVRGAARLVGSCVDATLTALAPLAGGLPRELEHDGLVALLNGVLGDHLAQSGNPLAIEMKLWHGGGALELTPEALRERVPEPRHKLLVLVHGSCRHHGQWGRRGHDDMGALARDLGFTPVYVHYNTGLHISTNGRSLAALLERLVSAWPVQVEEVAILGHSMGGLVARSASHVAEAEGHAWRRKLRKLVCVGAPHHGAPLERGGHWVDVLLGLSRYGAPFVRLGTIRSAGVTDLRFGNVLDEHRDPRGRFESGRDLREQLRLPDGVRCYAIAATRTRRPGAGRYASDGLVPVDSALGRHRRPELTLAFDGTWIAFGTGHVELLERPEVHEVIRSWLSDDAKTPAGPGVTEA